MMGADRLVEIILLLQAVVKLPLPNWRHPALAAEMHSNLPVAVISLGPAA